MLKANLVEIKKLLEKFRYTCEMLNKSEEFPIDQLIVKLEDDYQARTQLLIIRASSQNLSSQDARIGLKSNARNYQELQLISTLPFHILDNQIPDLARLILLLNKGMELPGFELSEVDHLIFFRHAFVVPEDDLDERILLSLVGMIELLLSTFTETLEAVAIGNRSLREIIEDAQKKVNENLIKSAAQ